MAKKNAPPPSGEGPERRGRPGPVPSSSGPVDGNTAESDPTEAGPSPKPKAPRAKRTASLSALDRAHILMEKALGLGDPKRRIGLAREALALSADCSEAYVLLAEAARTRKEAIVLLQQAVDAEARVLGPELFRHAAGHFWAITETRPYMRARVALAEALWESGRREEATGHLLALLDLNPGDNQGLRYTLAGWLLNLDRLDELDLLLGRFDEDSTTWAFTRALASFRRKGDAPASRKLLQAARKANKHVVPYLLGQQPLPSAQPPYYSPGDEDDAILYVGSHLGAWKSAPGAVAWVRSKVKAPKKRGPKPSASIGPSPGSRESLGRLPIEPDTWQADFRQFPRRIEVNGERVRPWMVLVSSRTRDQVLAHALTDDTPTPEALWDIVASAMESPASGEPHRPSELLVRPMPPWDDLDDHFERIGVACSRSDVLDQIDFLFEDLNRHMAGSEPPGLLEMPGVSQEQVGQFYEAAAAFYLRAPWRLLGYEAVIRVECDRYQSGPWFAVIMGQSGLTLGLALYEDLSLLRKMWAGKLSEEQGARRTVALTVTFDDESTLSEGDLDAIEANGWPIPSPDAYPSIFRKERGLSMRPPLAWEIDLMVACLRLIPDFVARRPADDPTRELVPVPDSSPPLELGMSWIEEPI